MVVKYCQGDGFIFGYINQYNDVDEIFNSVQYFQIDNYIVFLVYFVEFFFIIVIVLVEFVRGNIDVKVIVN